MPKERYGTRTSQGETEKKREEDDEDNRQRHFDTVQIETLSNERL